MTYLEIEANNLIHIRGLKLLFNDLSIKTQSGQLYCIYGSNGSGKTTLLKIIAGIISPTSGTISYHFNKRNYGKKEGQEKIFYFGHDINLYSHFSVIENIRFYQSLLSLPDQIKNSFQISNLLDKKTRNLSAGEKKKIILSLMISSQRPCWILDEPMTNLDIQAQTILQNEIKAHLKQKGTVLLATHQNVNIPATQINLSTQTISP